MNLQVDRIYSKMVDKVAREAINRNTATRLSYQTYLNHYENIHSLPSSLVSQELKDSNSIKKYSSKSLQRPQTSKPSRVLALVDQAYSEIERKTDHIIKMRTIVPNYYQNP
jgi:hypothetical protein